MSEWISVEEQLPPVEKCVITWSDDHDFMYVDGIDQWCIWDSREWVPEGMVTHWMPLPEPPESTS